MLLFEMLTTGPDELGRLVDGASGLAGSEPDEPAGTEGAPPAEGRTGVEGAAEVSFRGQFIFWKTVSDLTHKGRLGGRTRMGGRPKERTAL